MVVVGFLGSFLENGSDRLVLCERDSDPAVVVVYAGPLTRVHQRLLVGDHLIQLLELPLLPRQLVIHNSSSGTPGRRTQLPPPLVGFFMLLADFAPLLGDPVLAPAATPARALATTSAATLAAAPRTSARPLTASTSPVPAGLAIAVTVDAAAAFTFDNTTKLVSGWTPAPTLTPAFTPPFTPTPAPAAAVPSPRGAIVPPAD